jgi:hypothetical protein
MRNPSLKNVFKSGWTWLGVAALGVFGGIIIVRGAKNPWSAKPPKEEEVYVPDWVLILADEVTVLERRTTAAYETGQHELAEDLDAEYAEKKEILESATSELGHLGERRTGEEPLAHDGAFDEYGLMGQLANVGWRYQRAHADDAWEYWTTDYDTRAKCVKHARMIIADYGHYLARKVRPTLSDDEVWAAIEDAGRRVRQLRGRRKHPEALQEARIDLDVLAGRRKAATPVPQVLSELGLEVGDYNRDSWLVLASATDAYQVKLEGWGSECVEGMCPAIPDVQRKTAIVEARKLAEQWRGQGWKAGVWTTTDDEVWAVTWGVNGPLDHHAADDFDPDDILDVQ